MKEEAKAGGSRLEAGSWKREARGWGNKASDGIHYVINFFKINEIEINYF